MNSKTRTSVPPQAYTRETLTKAFEWLKTQPQSVKERIVSADSLVQEFIHSKRFGPPTLALLDDQQPNLEDLISVENFKQDLKDLAQGLKQFEHSSSASVSEPRPSTSFRESDAPNSPEPHRPPPKPEASSPAHEEGVAMNTMPPSASFSSSPASNPTTGPSTQGMIQGWDEKTYWAVKTTRDRFNLSSDQEALRMLVATGFDRLRESFPKGF